LTGLRIDKKSRGGGVASLSIMICASQASISGQWSGVTGHEIFTSDGRLVLVTPGLTVPEPTLGKPLSNCVGKAQFNLPRNLYK